MSMAVEAVEVVAVVQKRCSPLGVVVVVVVESVAVAAAVLLHLGFVLVLVEWME